MQRPFAALVLGVASCRGHAHIAWPPSRHDGSDNWFTQLVHIPGEPTNNDPRFRTVNVNVNEASPADWSRKNPWRAPGTASVKGSGCGVAGGGTLPYDGTGPGVPKGTVQGQDGQTLPARKPTVWKTGSVQEVAWGIGANHAGGYSWRLCRDTSADSRSAQATGAAAGEQQQAQQQAASSAPLPTCVADATCKDPQGCRTCAGSPGWACDECCDGCWKVSMGGPSIPVAGFLCGCPPPNPVPPAPLNPDVDEACFQANTLRFASNSSWIEWANGTRHEFPLRKVTEGTFPPGSEWARNPIPGCNMCNQYKECGPAPAFPGNNVHDMEFLNYAWCSGYCIGQCQHGPHGEPNGCPAGKEHYPALAGVSGYGYDSTPGAVSHGWDWNIVDKVHVPAGLQAGRYLLSWRWDCEQTPQVWQSCSDILIEA